MSNYKIPIKEFKLFYKVMKNMKISDSFNYYRFLQIYGDYGKDLIEKENKKRMKDIKNV